jgi:hypothetical protein
LCDSNASSDLSGRCVGSAYVEAEFVGLESQSEKRNQACLFQKVVVHGQRQAVDDPPAELCISFLIDRTIVSNLHYHECVSCGIVSYRDRRSKHLLNHGKIGIAFQ